MNKQRKDILVVGFALFAMFFGAGNLIFPPLLGVQAGDAFPIVSIGFLLAGVGLPLLGVIATAKAGGRIEHLAGKVSPGFAALLGTVIILCIGPLFAIPRTAATTFEVGVLPMFPTSPAWLTSLIFFAVTLYFVINPSKVIDHVGKYLTPLLLAVLAIMIVRALTNPLGAPVAQESAQWFSRGFTEGYQTMDALASVIFTTIVVASVTALGYKEGKPMLNVTAKSAILAAVLLLIVYGGLTYIGATGSGIYEPTVDRTFLIIDLVQRLLGSAGSIVLGLAISLACLSTSIGLVSSTGDFFSNLTKGKLSYRLVCIITVFVSFWLSILGVEAIINFAGPVLAIVYPPVIVLIVLNLLGPSMQKTWIYRAAVIGALVVSAIEILTGTFSLPIAGIVEKLPLHDQGFGWITGTILFLIIGAVIQMATGKKEA